jgi:23S rRNA (guanosine2251-2'-O)-methyltransferase
MTKTERKRRPSPDRRSDAPSGERGNRRSSPSSDSRSGSGRPNGPRPGTRPGSGGQGQSRRDDDRSGSGGQGRPRRDDDRPNAGGQGRPRRDDDRPNRSDRPSRPNASDRSERPSGPRGQDRPRSGDDRPPRTGSRPGEDRRFERDNDRRGPRRERFEDDRPAARPPRTPEPRLAEAPARTPEALPEDILPGRKPVRELVEQSPKNVDDVLLRQGLRGADVDAIIRACEAAGVRYRFMPAGDLDRIYPGNHQGVMARLAAGELASLEDVLAAAKDAPLPVVLALDRVQDPGNVGALARTLYALGGGGILVPKHDGARLGPGAAKASAGTLARLPVAKVTNLSQALDEAKEAGFTIIGAAGEAEAENIHTARPPLPLVLVLGSEEEGMRPGIRKRCDLLYRIPQARPIDSLNVAQAGAIILGRLSSLLDTGN